MPIVLAGWTCIQCCFNAGPTVCDTGPTLKQHCHNVVLMLGERWIHVQPAKRDFETVLAYVGLAS